jgi:hypothetical protein
VGGFELLAFVESDGSNPEMKMPTLDVEALVLTPNGGHQFIDASMMPIEGSILGAIAATQILDAQNNPCTLVAFEVSGTKPSLIAIGCNGGMPKPQSFDVGEPWGGAYFADVNGDNYPDLIYGQILGGVPKLRRRLFDPALNDFEPANAPTDLLLGVDTDGCIAGSSFMTSEPLAIGDINGDGRPDFVDAKGILFYNAYGGPSVRACNSSDVRWTQAVAGDFNGDGLNDVVAARAGEAVLDVWYALAEGNFNTFTVAVSGFVAELVGGDFDGDTIMDAAFRFELPGTMNPMAPPMRNPGDLYVMFGEPLAVPSPPVPLGPK